MYSSRTAVDAVLTEALDAATTPAAPDQINRVTVLLVNRVGVKLAVARRVSQWIAPQLVFLAEAVITARHQAEHAEAFIGENGLLAAMMADLTEQAPVTEPAATEPETLAEVTAETDIFCRFEFQCGGLCGEDALSDSPYCHSHQHADLPAPEVVAPARPARRFRLGKSAPCLTPAAV